MLPIDVPVAPADIWPLEKDIHFFNHGSFGSCPRAILFYQDEIRARMERQPIQFFVRDLESLLDQARKSVAEFLNAFPEDLVFVSNATTGVNAVLQSFPFLEGDELLVTNHEYNACRNIADFVACQRKIHVVEAAIPFPFSGSQTVLDLILEKISPRTRLVLIDHVTSPTGMVLPLEKIISPLKKLGVAVLVDGAHAPGMLPLDLKSLDPDFYTGNFHKWVCSPKGSAFLYVNRSYQSHIRPVVISHGANSSRTDRSRFLIEFCWTGTGDVSAFLSVPESIRYFNQLFAGGWEAIRQRNRSLALAARQILCSALKIEQPCPEEYIGSLAAIPIPDAPTQSVSPLYTDELQETLWHNYKIEVPVIPWPKSPKRLLRISAQLYNHVQQFETLAKVLKQQFLPK